MNNQQTLRDWLRAEPFTLTMSSGFFSFFAHAGMLSVLEKERLIPARITGSSAGGLVGTLWASGCDMPELQARLFTLTKDDFWDPAPGLGLLRGVKFRTLLSDIAGVARLEECRVPVALSLYHGFTRSIELFTSGPLADIVYGTCAVPFMFQPIRINGKSYWDGGIRDRPGLAGTNPSERIFYHYIESRSPWRRADDLALQIPTRDNLRTLVIGSLPRLGPNRLDLGQSAFDHAWAATERALDQPFSEAGTVAIEPICFSSR